MRNGRDAYFGLVGEVVRAIEPHTEADPVAILIQYLAFFGNAVGRGPHFRVEGDRKLAVPRGPREVCGINGLTRGLGENTINDIQELSDSPPKPSGIGDGSDPWPVVFDDFCHANDPHEEHDFGSFETDGHMIMFKIDYFDQSMSTHSPDPADPSVTQRVITIMLAEEY